MGNQRCDIVDDDDDATGVRIPISHHCFAGDTKAVVLDVYLNQLLIGHLTFLR